MYQNQLTKYSRPSDIPPKNSGWLSSQIAHSRGEIQEAIKTELSHIIKSGWLELVLLISSKELAFLELELVKNRISIFVQPRHCLQSSPRNDSDWDFLNAHSYDNQTILLEELIKHIKPYLMANQSKQLRVFENEKSSEISFLDDKKSWKFKIRNDSHESIPCIGILSMTTAMFPTRNAILFICELSCYISNHLGISEQSQSQSQSQSRLQLPHLSSSYDSRLKSNTSIGFFSMCRMSFEHKIYSSLVRLSCNSGPTCDPSRLVIETDHHINSKHYCSCSCSCLCLCSLNICSLHQKSTSRSENHSVRVHGLTSSSTHWMQPKSSRQLPNRRSSPAFSRNFKLHASMVGSYEECLIHGRMSTTPSKTFVFFAEISVLGTNKCTTNFRYPTHINMPFSAVFYSYESSVDNRNPGLEARQSPYVGLIDLEKGSLNNCFTQNIPSSRAGSRHISKREYRKDEKRSSNYNTNQISGYKNCHAIKSGRRLSTCLPPTGGYRIPKIGQVQIIIRNLNKTPVKVFLVPYNLSEMSPGTKTFIRQRSYVTKTVIDEPLRSNSSSSKTKSSESQILHSLAHIQICSPSRNRFYLYKGIRLVFENRITDCGEELRKEVSLPEPRYSNYKPES